MITSCLNYSMHIYYLGPSNMYKEVTKGFVRRRTRHTLSMKEELMVKERNAIVTMKYCMHKPLFFLHPTLFLTSFLFILLLLWPLFLSLWPHFLHGRCKLVVVTHKVVAVDLIFPFSAVSIAEKTHPLLPISTTLCLSVNSFIVRATIAMRIVFLLVWNHCYLSRTGHALNTRSSA